MKGKNLLGCVCIVALLLSAVFLLRRRETLILSPQQVAIPDSLVSENQTVASNPQNLNTTPPATLANTSNASSILRFEPRVAPDPERDPKFAAFEAWIRRYEQADIATKSILETEGEVLAQARLTALADLVQNNPEHALEMALPFALRAAVPDALRSKIEERINTRGDLAVIAAFSDSPSALVPPLMRQATIDGQDYQVFTYGKGLNFMTKQGVPLNGITVPNDVASNPYRTIFGKPKKLLALSESPIRVADRDEVKALESARAVSREPDPICSVSGKAVTANQEETVLEFAGNLHAFCGKIDAAWWAEANIQAAGLTLPSINGTPTPKSSYTEGRKRMFCMRPYWSDFAPVLSTNEAITRFVAFSNYMAQMTFGKLLFAGLGRGSDISADLLLPGPVATYDNTGLGLLYNVSKDVARTNYNYDLNQYDFIYVMTGSKPAAGYCGLAFVGGVGFHLPCWGEGVAGHEFGHNLGLNHANFWNTDSRSIAGFGQSIEYGDSTDPMGGASGLPEHYGSRYKNYLGFITNSDIASITSSGTYRLYAEDGVDAPGNYRGLKFVRTGSQNYWVQFRQLYTTKALFNGVQLLWTGNGNEHSQLLDTRLKNSWSDNALVIGRTFSDTNLGLHITPVGKGHTYPESMDVVVNVGSFAANQPPIASVSASTTNASTGQTITFAASATDANGDALAYSWDFDDADFSIDNSSTTTHSFTSAGEYVVQCTVSDMKGGVARDSVLVRVGNPSTFRISGHVFDASNRPLGGARVFVNSTTDAITDSDGKYTIARLSAGSYTVDINDFQIDNQFSLHPFFNNPITVGPNFTTADFSTAPLASFYSVLVAKKSGTWKYLDTGADQGTGWSANGFVDTAWSTGTGIFGYGGNTDATTGVTGNRTNTYYFRKTFTVNNPALYSSLLLEVARESGVIVYLNGTEVYRDNMPAGGVSYLTAAVNSVTAHTYRRAVVPANLLVSGNNVVAAEVHLFGPSDDSMRFDLGLSALPLSVATNQNFVYLTSPEQLQNFTAPANVTIDASASSTRAAVTNVEFHADGAKIGEDAASPYHFVWSSPATGAHTLRAVAALADGLQVTSAPVNITVSAPVAPPVLLGIIQTNATWRYYCTNIGAAAGWQNLNFNDSTWITGAARLGFNSGSGGGTNISTIIYGGPSSARYPAAYFRNAFVVNDPSAITNLIVTLARDDGAIVYLNGVEIIRDNIQNGVAVTYSTLATNVADNGQTYFTYTISPAGLVPGTNVIAVEVHQTSASSSDLAFDLWLNGFASTNRARGCWLAAPTNGSTIALPGSVTLAAEVVAGGFLGVTNVEFYSDGIKVGEDGVPPFSFTWNTPPGGAHSLTAIAYDSDGDSITSAPVNVTVSSPPNGDALISFGDVWKYEDNGLNLGTAWSASAYNDNAWMMGPARLGYGGDGEITTVSYGTNANSKYITTYFRKKFFVANPAAFSGLLLRLIRDDGPVVYLNGVEIYRTNLLAGTVSYNSLALTAIGGADETTPLDVTLTTAGLIPGTNTLAVEMHQDSVTSSDIGFDLALIGLHNTNTMDGIYLTSPAHNTHYNMPATVSLTSYAASSAGAISLVEYYDGGGKVGQAASVPFAATWSGAPAGLHFLTAVATFGANQKMTSAPVAVVVGPAPPTIAPVFTPFINYGTAWKYWDTGTGASNGWQNLAFDDSAWPIGNARLGWGLDGESTLLTSGRTTHYFRKTFVVTNGAALDTLTFNVIRDDGVVVYLNGLEVFRTNMPSGTIAASTLASVTINTPDETIPVVYSLATPGSGLLYGTNVIAVELHQATVGSSDAGFDLYLYGEGTSEARIYLGSPPNHSIQVAGLPIQFTAHAQAAAGRTLTAVEFFSDGTNFGQATALPYQVNCSGISTGLHTIVARSIDNLGNSLTSAPVQITVGYQPISLVLVPAGSLWKYLDDGSNQGTNWAQTNFVDTSWASGFAELGYGDLPEGRPEVTVLCCSNAASKFITYYFRRAFIVPPDTFLTNLTFRLMRDDGAVVWLNGREMYRSNMPNTTITYTTPASTAIGGTDEATFFVTALSTTNAHAGTNLLAVEIHQQSTTSSDVSFDLQLEGVGYVVSVTPPELAASTSGGQFRVAWPASATGFQLYSSPQIGAGAVWQMVNGSIGTSNGFNVLTVPATNPATFYRLQK